MALWIWLLTAFAFVGGVSDRTFVHVSSTSCSACQRIQPLVDQLRAEGWSIRSMDAQKDRLETQRWSVRSVPTLIVLESGVEVDRIVGSLPFPELRTRLTRNELPHATVNKLSDSYDASTGTHRNSIFGPNHPHSKSNSISASNLRKESRESRKSSPNRLIGPNHPFYSLYNRSDVTIRQCIKHYICGS